MKKASKKASMKKRIISAIPAVVLMVVIFINSDKTAVQSSAMSDPLADMLMRIYGVLFGKAGEEVRPETFDLFSSIVRKMAHVCEYALLAVFVNLHVFESYYDKDDGTRHIDVNNGTNHVAVDNEYDDNGGIHNDDVNRKRRNTRLVIMAALFCVIYAATDEFHQYFIEGRSGEFKDVCIDGIGAVLGTMSFYFYKHLRKGRKSH